MAFADGITTLYFPTTSEHDDLPWGTETAALKDTPLAGFVGRIQRHTGTGTTFRTFSLQTTNNFNANDYAYGWGLLPSDVNSVVGALRYIPAGTWTFSTQGRRNAGDADGNRDLEIRVYVIADPYGSGDLTLIGTNIVSLFWDGSLSPKSVSVNLPQINFAEDDTLMVGIRTQGAGVFLNDLDLLLYSGHYTTGDGASEDGDAILTFPGLFTEGSVLEADGASSVAMQGGAGAGTMLTASGASALEFFGIGRGRMQWAAQGQSDTAFPAAAAALARFQMAGMSTTDLYLAATAMSRLEAQGQSDVNLLMVAARKAILTAEGSSMADLRAGRGIGGVLEVTPGGGVGDVIRPTYIFDD